MEGQKMNSKRNLFIRWIIVFFFFFASQCPRESPDGVVARVLNYFPKVSEFELIVLGKA